MMSASSSQHKTRAPWIPDASRMIRGENILASHTVTDEYVSVLDSVLADGVVKGHITQNQVDTGTRAAFAQSDGCLFVCLCMTDGSQLVYGTTVPAHSWWRK